MSSLPTNVDSGSITSFYGPAVSNGQDGSVNPQSLNLSAEQLDMLDQLTRIANSSKRPNPELSDSFASTDSINARPDKRVALSSSIREQVTTSSSPPPVELLLDYASSDMVRSVVTTSSSSPVLPTPIDPSQRREVAQPLTDLSGLLMAEMDQVLLDFKLTLQEKLETFVTRLTVQQQEVDELRELSGRQGEEIQNLQARVEELEKRDPAPPHVPEASIDWQPAAQASGTNIMLFGDSNYAGQIKFGDAKGTLGPSLPGTHRFVPTISDMTTIHGQTELQDHSALVIAVGTNSLLRDCTPPAELAGVTHGFVKQTLTQYPALQIVLVGVLPTDNDDANAVIDIYNANLRSMAASLPRTTYLDTGFVRDHRTGKLMHKFTKVENNCNILVHLNEAGLKMMGSRLKRALRVLHDLPVLPTATQGYIAQAHGDGGISRESGRGGSRGAFQRGRGGRGRGGRGRGQGDRGGAGQQMETTPATPRDS